MSLTHVLHSLHIWKSVGRDISRQLFPNVRGNRFTWIKFDSPFPEQCSQNNACPLELVCPVVLIVVAVVVYRRYGQDN